MNMKYLQIIAFTGFSLGMLGQGNAIAPRNPSESDYDWCLRKCYVNWSKWPKMTATHKCETFCKDEKR